MPLKFEDLQVGDLLIANDRYRYFYTNSKKKCIVEVVELFPEHKTFNAKIIAIVKADSDLLNEVYNVEPAYFDKINPSKLKHLDDDVILSKEELVLEKKDKKGDDVKMKKVRKAYLDSNSRSREINEIKIINNTEGKPVAIEMDVDGIKVRSVCNKNDEFNLEMGITVCLLKACLSEYNGTKEYNKLIKDCLKQIKDTELAVEEKKAEEERIAKKKAKAAAKRKANFEKKKAAQRAEQVAIQTEAYIAAIKATGVAPKAPIIE